MPRAGSAVWAGTRLRERTACPQRQEEEEGEGEEEEGEGGKEGGRTGTAEKPSDPTD